MGKLRITEKSDLLHNGQTRKRYHVMGWDREKQDWSEFAFSQWFDTLEQAEDFVKQVIWDSDNSVKKSSEVTVKIIEF